MKRHQRQKSPAKVAKASHTIRRKLSQAKVAYDVATASAQTIGRRAAMIGKAMTNPAELANPEFTTMGHEKMLVAGQMATAAMRRLGGAQRLWADFWFQQMQRSYATLPQLASSRTPARLMEVAVVSAGDLIADYMAFWMKATTFSDTIANAVAKPVHRAVASNAKRLARAA